MTTIPGLANDEKRYMFTVPSDSEATYGVEVKPELPTVRTDFHFHRDDY
jgi:hypothetical protein